MNKLAAEQERLAKLSQQKRSTKLAAALVGEGEGGEGGEDREVVERATSRYEADLAREAAAATETESGFGGLGGLMRTFSGGEEALYDDEYDDAMDEFDPSGGIGGGTNEMVRFNARFVLFCTVCVLLRCYCMQCCDALQCFNCSKCSK